MSISELLFPNQYRRKVLVLLLTNPSKSLHLRELARLTAASPGTLKKELDALTAVGLLLVCKVGNQTQFRANTEHPVYPELLALIHKTIGLHDVIAAALEPLGELVEVAFVFGSVARATETSHSDVDLLLIGNATFGQVVNALYDAQTTLGREINPKVMTRQEWQEKRTQGNVFMTELLNKPKVFVVGTANDL
jgi:predicted nucleotidyltransferase